MLKIGQKAPHFEKLKKYLGKNDFLVVYFYPKDFTPGCTNEACSLRDNWENLKKHKISVVGISPDSEESHKKFISKYSLPFNLISDKEKLFLNSYNSFGEKLIYGKKTLGVLRKTYIINKKGIIIEIISEVNTKNHFEQIINLLKNKIKTKSFKVTKKSIISEIIDLSPESAFIFSAYGLHCAGCFISDIDTIEQGAKSHGLDDSTVEMIIRDINKLISSPENSYI